MHYLAGHQHGHGLAVAAALRHRQGLLALGLSWRFCSPAPTARRKASPACTARRCTQPVDAQALALGSAAAGLR